MHAQRKSKSIQLWNESGRWTLYSYLTSNFSCYDFASPLLQSMLLRCYGYRAASEALPRFLLASQACGEGVRFCKFLLLAGVHAEPESKSIQVCNEFGRWTLYRYLTSNLSCYDFASPSSKQVSHLLCVPDEPWSNIFRKACAADRDSLLWWLRSLLGTWPPPPIKSIRRIRPTVSICVCLPCFSQAVCIAFAMIASGPC